MHFKLNAARKKTLYYVRKQKGAGISRQAITYPTFLVHYLSQVSAFTQGTLLLQMGTPVCIEVEQDCGIQFFHCDLPGRRKPAAVPYYQF